MEKYNISNVEGMTTISFLAESYFKRPEIHIMTQKKTEQVISNASNIFIKSEYQKIIAKKSKLSKSKRDLIQAQYEYRKELGIL